MTYRVRGLDPEQFEPLFAFGSQELSESRATLLRAGTDGRYPCRVSLEDATPGEELALVHFTNHAVETPYRNAFAIYVRRDAARPADFEDSVPPILRGRPIALRRYTSEGNLQAASLALNDDVDQQVRALLKDEKTAYIDAHNAMHGCFAARIERHGEER